MTVKEWLDSGRDYEVGRQLYAVLGTNDRLKRLLADGPNHYNREALAWELTKLARAGVVTAVVTTRVTRGEPGLDEFGNRVAPAHYFLPLAKAEKLQNATKTLQNVETPPENVDSSPQKAGELLAELKAEQRRLYDERAGVHAQLEGAADEEERRLMAARVMSLSRQLDANWSTYHYVEAHGERPPAPAAAPGLDQLAATDLLKRRNNLRSQVSKLKKQPHRADDLVRVEAELVQVESLLNPS